jgi:predicted neuraminidase
MRKCLSKRSVFRSFILVSIAILPLLQSATAQGESVEQPSGIVKSEFVADLPPTPFNHTSTIVETRAGLVAAWVGASRERALDATIWLARNEAGGWARPTEVANGNQAEEGRRYPCWNPVLFVPKNGPLLLFYKIGPSPESWWGMMKTSWDHGRSWSKSSRLPQGIIGPSRNKPVELPGGTLLCGSSTENAGWRVHMERTSDFGKTWTRTDALNSAMEFGAIQPTVLLHHGGRIQILCRTKQKCIVESWSKDSGKTWTPLDKTRLPNSNSALDGVVLRDGRALLVYNQSTEDRHMLNVAVSTGGENWQAALVLENQPGDYYYPAVIQSSDELVHVTYTSNRERIKHVVIDPAKLNVREMPAGQWP